MRAFSLEAWNFTWRRGLSCENAISLASSISSLAEAGKVVVIACPTAFRHRVELPEDVRRVDLLAQVAQEVLLAGDPHEVRVGVPVADVVERVFVAELLVARLEVDARVVAFGAADVLVVVAVVHHHVGAPERVHEADEACEVDVHDPVQLQRREHFPFDRFGRQQAALARASELAADRVGGVDLLVGVFLALPGPDRDQQVAGDRHQRRLPLARVEADEQDRVAVGRVFAVEGVVGVGAAVGPEHQEGLGAAFVFGGDQALGGFDVAEGGEHLGGQLVDLVERHGGGRGAG